MTEKHLLGAGNVTVTLGAPDDTADYVLKPTPLVIKTLCATYGGLRPCIERVQALDLNMALHAITLGVGVKGRAATELEDRFWQTATANLIGPLTSFLLVLANGGRPITEADDKKDDDEGAEGNG